MSPHCPSNSLVGGRLILVVFQAMDWTGAYLMQNPGTRVIQDISSSSVRTASGRPMLHETVGS